MNDRDNQTKLDQQTLANEGNLAVAKANNDTQRELLERQIAAGAYRSGGGYGGSGYTRSSGGYSGGSSGNGGSNNSGNAYTINTNEATQAWLDAVEAWGSHPSTKNNSNLLILGKEILTTQGVQNPSQDAIIAAAHRIYNEMHPTQTKATTIANNINAHNKKR